MSARPQGSPKSRRRRVQPSPLPAHQFARRVLLAAGICLALLAAALLLWYSVYVILLMFAGVLVAVMLRALADPVTEWTGLSHRWSLGVVLVVVMVFFAGLGWLAAGALLDQVAQLSDRLPQAAQLLREQLAQTELGRLIFSYWDPQQAFGAAGTLLGRFGGLLTNLVDLVTALVVVLFTGLFLAFDPTLYVRGALRLLPLDWRHRGGEVLGAIGYTLKWWIIGQGITMVVIAVATSIGLWLLGVPLALLLGVIAGLFNFIPNFGPLFALVPATVLALAGENPQSALWVIVMFLVIQNLEGNLLTPMVQRRAVELPPAMGIIAQILLGILTGFLGLILAWPLAAAVHVAVKMLYVEDVLGDRIGSPGDNGDVKEVQQATDMAEQTIEDGERRRAEDDTARTAKPNS